MIDIKLIRDNPELIQEKAKQKRVDVDVHHILEIDEEYKKLLQQVQQFREERNIVAKERNVEKGKEIKEKLDKLEPALAAVGQELAMWVMKIPNMPDDSVPVGKDESENVVLRSWGEPKKFDFPIKDHIELGKLHNIIDTEKASQVVGSRFTYLKGDAVLLQFALINFALSVLTNPEKLAIIAKKVSDAYPNKPFIPVIPPVMIHPEVYTRMARLDLGQEDERYFLPKDNLYLIGSAEHTLGPLHIDETLPQEIFPLRYVGYSTSFRREAGSYGKDVKGILRVHQFDKIEIESFTLPEDSMKEQAFIVAIQEYMMQALNLPYRVVDVCTGDMGVPDAKQIDIETWMPAQNMYRETHSADNVTDYQARRLHTKVRKTDGSTELVHMNDATVFAIGRTLIAILENYQQADGSITIPEVLIPFVGKDKISTNT